MENPVRTVVIQDVIAAELHDPAHLALIVSSPGTSETTRLGMATNDVSLLIVNLMKILATAMPHQTPLKGGPSQNDAPRLELEDARVTRTADGSQVALVLHCNGGLQIPLTFPPETALRFAALLQKHAREEDGATLH